MIRCERQTCILRFSKQIKMYILYLPYELDKTYDTAQHIHLVEQLCHVIYCDKTFIEKYECSR